MTGVSLVVNSKAGKYYPPKACEDKQYCADCERYDYTTSIAKSEIELGSSLPHEKLLVKNYTQF